MIKIAQYPQNLILKSKIIDSGLKIGHLSEKMGISRKILSRTINGHHKGVRIVKMLNEILSAN